jgi:ketosteroid isomerase-like protein
MARTIDMRRSVVEHDEAIGMLKSIAAAFDGHDLDGILLHFADDAIFESPRGPDPWGQRFVGKRRSATRLPAASRGSLTSATRTTSISSMASEAPRNGRCPARRSMASGSKSEGATCGPSRDGKVVKKDSYWKIRTTD